MCASEDREMAIDFCLKCGTPFRGEAGCPWLCSEDREKPGAVHEVTVAEIVVRLRLEAHGRWDRGSYLGAADFIEREFGERDARTHEDETPKENT